MAYTTIDDPSAYFQTALYNGSASSVTVTNDGNSDLQPDWLWFKKRSATGDHNTFDTSRGLTERLFPNLTSAVDTGENGITSLTNGFTSGTFYGDVNGAGNTFVTWQWKANGGTTASNTDGSITSTVQANTTAGFSIVTYTGTGSNATVGHGLGAVPKMVICKNRNSAGTNWQIYHAEAQSSGADQLKFTTDAVASNIAVWNDTAPSSSVFTVGTGDGVNKSGDNLIAYCFAEKQGYSKFGSYTGNGNADGPFVYTGFKPAFVMIKGSSLAENWVMQDTARDTYNLVYHRLDAERANAETTNIGSLYPNMDYVSNGFKIRGSGNVSNGSGQTYIYMAFAESPFVSSEGVPTTAR